jgi:hypothetical protein
MADLHRQGRTGAEFYDALGTEPLSRLAPKCGIADVGLAKVCRRPNISIPGRGYWRKVETRKRVPKRQPLRPHSPTTLTSMPAAGGSNP